ncbi:DUF6463 family protein [Nocardia sp. CDC160]|uniref:DUF6463 family protein n=1 Tax=Nocardia sp. CDC160 TaxID=3112166 RepID=UPI002DBDEA40|nr:DUF6463 family protein [Nocardia sp. CDC160]MEC3918698.1 DUF6463 family protein [Nocardia sp. CDC160]
MTTNSLGSPRAVMWAGRLLALLGTGHTIGALVDTRQFLGDWLTGELWDTNINLDSPQPIVGAFFVSVASFGVPLIVVGLAISWIGRQGLVPPPYLAVIIAAWIIAVDGLGGRPSPLEIGFISIAILLVAARRQARQVAVHSEVSAS